MNMHAEAERFVFSVFSKPLRVAVLEALELIPSHLVPRITIDSQSPWICVDALPGPQLGVWRATGDIYEVGEDGAVGDDPIKLRKRDNPPPKGFVWGCEDCTKEKILWVTDDTRYANFHSDAHGHSLALLFLRTLQ
jgi:hypothetical protein